MDAMMVQNPQINKCDMLHKMKDKNHMIISIDAEIVFDKIQHPFMINTLSKVGLEVTFLNIIKAIYGKLTASTILNMKKTISIPLKIKNKTGMSTSTSLIQHSTGSPGHNSQTRRKK